MWLTLPRAGALACALLIANLVSPPAQAQSAADIPPVYPAVDENGVDVVTGNVVATAGSISIGPGGPGSLAYNYTTANQAQAITRGFVTNNPPTADYSVTIGPSTETFQLSGALGSGTFSQQQGRGSTLTYDSATQRFTYTSAEGTVGVFAIYTAQSGDAAVSARILTLTYPAGERLTFAYRTDSPSTVQSVWSNLGYQLRFVYGGTPLRLTDVLLFNMADETCDPNAASCTLTGTWPRLTFDGTGGATDVLNRSMRIQTSSTQKIITFTGGRQVTYNLNTDGNVASVADGSRTWTYNYTLAQGVSQTTITGPTGYPPRTVDWDTTTGAVVRVQVGSGTSGLRTTAYVRDTSSGRLERIAYPDGTVETFLYDARGNVTERRRISATPETLADIVTTATYPATCSNQRTCNKPTATVDARLNQTDYAYSATHGGLTSVTLPAASNGVRPQVRYGYTAVSATYRNGSGTLIQGAPVYRQTTISQCATLSACTGTSASDEVRTTVSYGTNEALLPVAVTSGSGDGALAATTTYTYTPAGDMETVDGPLAGTADTSRNYYNAGRQLTGVIGPDPDGAGTLLRRAARISYNGEGNPTNTERGTATSQASTSMSTFVSLEQSVTQYDSLGRVVRESLTAGGTTYAVTQHSYNAAGLLDCTAVRMNPAQFASLPTSACVLDTAGNYGADRITRRTYNAFMQPAKVTTAVGVSLARDEITTTYTAAGLPETVADGRGNLTTYEYDGFSRLVRSRFPDATNGTVSSTTDYEQLTLDPNGNAIIRRLRDGQNIVFGYDNLNRMVSKDPPGTPLVSYSYDNLNRMTAASYSGHALSFTYDALGRNLTQTGPLGTVDYDYDLAGRRTRMTYPGTGLFIDYDYLVSGEVSMIRENGATSGVGILATYGYDNLGRRTSLTRGNGTSTTYGYDPVSRLASLAQSLPDTTYNLTLGFTYNPASQISTNTRSNDLYSYTGHANQNVTDSHDGLNEITLTGATGISYDARHNIAAIGATTYTYNAENMLTSGGGANLFYDPLLRLYQLSGTRWAYDGDNMIAEYSTSNVLRRRYVFGPGTDEPLVWYEGTGTTDRRFLHADERGSIIAVSDSAGTVIGTNSYDEYGVPENPLAGRFHYAGRPWMASLGLYYYRARFYNPSLGRFMQPDPIGYGGGMNLYAYVSGDPVNLTDPTGLCIEAQASRGSDTSECGIFVTHAPWYAVHYSTSSFDFPPQVGTLPGHQPSFIGAGGGGGVGDRARASCPTPTSVHLEGTLDIAAAMHTTGRFFGTLEDVVTGRKYSFDTGMAGGGVGLALGSYHVSGTLRGSFDVFSRGVEIRFFNLGIGPISLGGASIRGPAGSLGKINVSGSVAPPLGSALISFGRTEATMEDRGTCR